MTVSLGLGGHRGVKVVDGGSVMVYLGMTSSGWRLLKMARRILVRSWVSQAAELMNRETMSEGRYWVLGRWAARWIDA